MSNIDITHFRQGAEVKVGEIEVGEDGILEGFLFDSPALRKFIADSPSSVTFAVVIHPAIPATSVPASDQLREIQKLLANEGVLLPVHQIESVLTVLQPRRSS